MDNHSEATYYGRRDSASLEVNKTPSRNKAANNTLMQRVAKWSFGIPKTGNALLHGDNLEILKLLKKTHANTVKCVYLDPIQQRRKLSTLF